MKGLILVVCCATFAVTTAAAVDFELMVEVIGDGRVDPSGGSYAAGETVTIQAWPETGCWVTSWSGTDNDWSMELSNTVTMDANKVVAVEFGPAIIVESPKEGDVWAAGSTHHIEWSTYDAGNIDIWLSKNGGISWQVIDVGVTDTGTYMWELPGSVNSSQCKILVLPSVPDANVIFMPSGLFTVQAYAAGPVATSKWESLAGHYDRMGLSENYGPELGCVKWEFEVDGAISGSVTIGPNDTVYVPCEDGNLYKLDSNGALLWTYEADSPLISSASIGPDGTAYVGAGNGRLYAVDIDGNTRWTHSTGGLIYSSPAVSEDGNTIFVGSEDGKLYALSPDGSELWSFETDGFSAVDGAIFSSPAIGADGTVYVAGLYDPNLYALDPNDGSTKWVCSFGSMTEPFDPNSEPFTQELFRRPVASPVVSVDGTIYQTLINDPNLYAIDPNDGNILWATNLAEIVEEQIDPEIRVSHSLWFEPYYYDDMDFDRLVLCDFEYLNARWNVSDSGWSEPAVGPDGTIYVSFDDPWLRAVEPNGTIKWIRKVGSTSGFELTVSNDGIIYAASNDSNLYVVNPKGIEIARFDSNDHWLGFPVVSGDNTLLMGDSRDNSMLISYENNRLWAISSHGCEGSDLDLYWQGGPQDLNGDSLLSYLDVAVFAEDWLGCTDCRNREVCGQVENKFLAGDINRDRYVNFGDYAVIAEHWLSGY